MSDDQKMWIKVLYNIWRMNVTNEDYLFLIKRFTCCVTEKAKFENTIHIALLKETINDINLEEVKKLDGDLIDVGGITKPEKYENLH